MVGVVVVVVHETEGRLYDVDVVLIVDQKADEVLMSANAAWQCDQMEFQGVLVVGRSAGGPAPAFVWISFVSLWTGDVDAFKISSSVEALLVQATVVGRLTAFVDIFAGASVAHQTIASGTVALEAPNGVRAFVLTMNMTIAFVDVDAGHVRSSRPKSSRTPARETPDGVYAQLVVSTLKTISRTLVHVDASSVCQLLKSVGTGTDALVASV